MNVHDSENISAIMEDMKYTRVDEMDDANVIILNTCAIRENAHNKVMGMLGRIKHLNPNAILFNTLIKLLFPSINPL